MCLLWIAIPSGRREPLPASRRAQTGSGKLPQRGFPTDSLGTGIRSARVVFMSSTNSSAYAITELARFFRRNGYVRWQNPERQATEGQKYKKGDEVRLVAESMSELAVIRRLLKRAGFKPGRPFAKGRQFLQPIYGRQAVARFLELVKSDA